MVVAAGDVLANGRGIVSPVAWLAQQFPNHPVIFVPGNHDFEGVRRGEALERWRRHAEGTQVHVLYNEAVTLDGVEFLGTPLWTNFKLFGREYQEELQKLAKHQICDFSNNYDDQGRPWSPEWMTQEHETCRAWLLSRLSPSPDPSRPQVVVTHFAPHPGSAHPRWSQGRKPEESRLQAYWVNDCRALVRRATFWIHGHTHDSFDYEAEGCRIGCNPRGYSRLYNLSSSPQWQGLRHWAIPRTLPEPSTAPGPSLSC